MSKLSDMLKPSGRVYPPTNPFHVFVGSRVKKFGDWLGDRAYFVVRDENWHNYLLDQNGVIRKVEEFKGAIAAGIYVDFDLNEGWEIEPDKNS